MADGSAIEWTEATWNPTTGCDRISAGCDHCYALTLAKRLKAMGAPKYQNDGDPRTWGPGFGVAIHPDTLRIPYSWREPRMVFVNSMSDLFHARVPISFVRDVFAVMADTPHHTYQVLTKRSHRLIRLADRAWRSTRLTERRSYCPRRSTGPRSSTMPASRSHSPNASRKRCGGSTMPWRTRAGSARFPTCSRCRATAPS
jgi:Protein of unknown function (DUF5131)